VSTQGLAQRNAHRLEVTVLDDRDWRGRRPSATANPDVVVVTMLLWLSGNGTIVLADSTPGRAARTGKEVEESDGLFVSNKRIGKPRAVRSRSCHTGLDFIRVVRSLDEQAGANQEHERERYFGHNSPLRAGPCFLLPPAYAGFQRGIEIYVMLLADQPEDHTGGETATEIPGRRIEANSPMREMRLNGGDERFGSHWASKPSRPPIGEEEAFRQQLPNDAHPARTQSRLQRDLFSAE
jgi:hypothetical protein